MSATKSDLFVPIKIDENDLYTGVLKLLGHIRPNWIQENVKLKVNIYKKTNKFSFYFLVFSSIFLLGNY